ncbi:MAG: serine/threonine-protein kinase [Planctomycetia bacterium]|nr:serine/threonine-protein kinase [Planctomycetia bacterium]
MEQPTQLGPFRILRVIGRGGMGAVYEALHEETNEHVAVKVLMTNVDEDQELRTRFEAEIETLKRLRHPNIVRLFGFGQEDGMLYYAMEFVDGPSLQNLLKAGRFFSWEEVVHIGIEVCKALKHAHDRGIIHRDIKPANIIILSDGQVKVSDYGIAHFFGDSRLTTANMVIGTIEYMSPEQAQAGPLTPKSDIYSLGSLLYALIARRPPYVAKSLAEILQKYKFGPPESVRFDRPEVPSVLDMLILELLRVQPDKRPNDARIIGRRLEAIRLALGNQQFPNPFLDPENPNKIIPPSLLAENASPAANMPEVAALPASASFDTSQNTLNGDILFELNKSVPLRYPQNYQSLDKDSASTGPRKDSFLFDDPLQDRVRASGNEPGSLLHLGQSDNSRYDFLEETGQTAGTPRGVDHESIILNQREGQSEYNLASITGISCVLPDTMRTDVAETISSSTFAADTGAQLVVSSEPSGPKSLPKPIIKSVGTPAFSTPEKTDFGIPSEPTYHILDVATEALSKKESSPAPSVPSPAGTSSLSEMPTQWTGALGNSAPDLPDTHTSQQDKESLPEAGDRDKSEVSIEKNSTPPVSPSRQKPEPLNAVKSVPEGLAETCPSALATSSLDVPPQSGSSLGLEPALLGSVFSKSGTVPSDSYTKTSHFTPVKEEDLGRLSHELEPHSKYVSLKIWLFCIISILIGATVVYSLRSPSADTLYDRIDRKIQDADPDDYLSTLRSAEKDMRAFLSLYPNDVRAVKILDYSGELELGNLERRLERLIERKTRTRNLDPVEAIYIEAIRTAKADPEAGIPKLKAFIELFSTDERLQTLIPEHNVDEKPAGQEADAGTSGPLTAETAGSPSNSDSDPHTDLVRERRESFDRTIYGQCVILAKRQLEQINQDYQQSKSAQFRLLEGRLEYADSLDSVNPQQARAIRRAIVALYSNRIWAVELVAKAEKKLEEDERPE